MTVQTLAIIVLLVSFFVMIFLRFPIAYAVGLSSVLGLMVQGWPCRSSSPWACSWAPAAFLKS